MKPIILATGLFLLTFSSITFGESEAALERLKQVEDAKTRSWTFEIGYNEALEYSLDEVTGLKVPKNWKENAQFISPNVSRGLPATFDWRAKTHGLTPIKNQQQCGSCWAFGTVGVLESVLKIRDNLTLDISEQQLVSCNKEGWSCQGGYMAHKYHLSPGATSTEQFPYVAADVACKSGLSSVAKIDGWGYVGSVSKAPTIDQLKTAIAEYGPIAATVSASSTFVSYKSGIYNANDGWAINHLIVLVGWNDNGKYWILRNSWGATWGEEGYMRIGYGVNMVGDLASYVDYKPSCEPQPVAYTGEKKTIHPGDSVRLGDMAIEGQTYEWSPSDSLDTAKSSSPIATPEKTTTYTLRATSSCGSAERQVTVEVAQP